MCKIIQDLSDNFLKVTFVYSSRQTVSSVIDCVKRLLSQRFVLNNIGPASITRQNYITQHVTEFANILYNPQPDIPNVVAIIDSTYAYINKSTNFRVLRQSYSMHKGPFETNLNRSSRWLHFGDIWFVFF